MKKYFLLFHTIKYLKLIQIYFRLYYFVRNYFNKYGKYKYKLSICSSVKPLILSKSILVTNMFLHNRFVFLNKKYLFHEDIDWNYVKYGKLWTYNLTYFDYLNQDEISKKDALRLIDDFINKLEIIHDGLEPFPISIRGINWIKYLTQWSINDKRINDSLYAQYKILFHNLEYHLLGNHLLENAFSLLFASYYYEDEKFYKKAMKILLSELNEQVLSDGAHFELSPMYHQLMLYRVLDCINLVSNNNWKNQELLPLLIEKSELMLGWLKTMTYRNGDIPLFNDSTNGIAPTTRQLYEYAKRLNIRPRDIKLEMCGYRKITNRFYEIVIDVGDIGPDYIPGHAHSDTFNFELYVGDKPLIVDTGLSTYETNERRQIERSTKSHNTVEVNSEDQSEVWGGFRVARRAKVISLKESGSDTIEATHDGYNGQGVLHTRKFFMQEDKIIISDTLSSVNTNQGIAYVHFHPDVHLVLNGNILECDGLTIMTTGIIKLGEYEYSPEFNVRLKAQYAKMYFSREHRTEIIMNRKS